MNTITISAAEFVNLIRGARLLDHHSPRMEVERFTLDQWAFQADVSNPSKAIGVYVAPLLRGKPNIGSLRFEEIKSSGGIQ